MPKSQQVAALPWRKCEHGIEILLVTTRTTKRWVIPKGWSMDGKADHEAAAIEAFEEAGVRGVVRASSVGRYSYMKILRSGKLRKLDVRVYGLNVREELADWPERDERQRQWVTLSQAESLIGEVELLPVITKFAKNHRGLWGRLRDWWMTFWM
jgi:8-oxo-dGTP pyrophosphatase MutT (NUDIX family)